MEEEEDGECGAEGTDNSGGANSGGGGCDGVVRSGGGGGEHIKGHVPHSVMHQRLLEVEGASTLLSSEVTVATKASPMNTT